MMRPSLRLNLRAVHHATVHVDFDSYVWIVYNDNWELRRRTQQNKVLYDLTRFIQDHVGQVELSYSLHGNSAAAYLPIGFIFEACERGGRRAGRWEDTSTKTDAGSKGSKYSCASAASSHGPSSGRSRSGRMLNDVTTMCSRG